MKNLTKVEKTYHRGREAAFSLRGKKGWGNSRGEQALEIGRMSSNGKYETPDEHFFKCKNSILSIKGSGNL